MTSTNHERPTGKDQRPFSLRLRGKRFPFFGLTLAAMCGILFEEAMGVPSSWLLGVILLMGGLQMLSSCSQQWVQQFLVYGLIAVSFATLHAWQWQEAPGVKLSSYLEKEKESFLVEGIISTEVKLSQQGHPSFLIKVTRLELASEQIVNPGITMLVHWEGPMPAYGDLIRLRAVGGSPMLPKNPGEFNMASWLARQGVYTELKMDPSEPGEVIMSGSAFSVMRWAIALRHWAEETLELGIKEDVPVTNIIKAMVLGTKEKDASFDDFKLTGTMHLFAVSGLHVGMVAMMIWFFFKLVRLPVVAAVVMTLGVLLCYVMMTGCHIGSLRAGMMAALVLIGVLLYQRPPMINSLASAAFLLLLCDTNLLFSMGWEFSFAVVMAILLLAGPLEERLQRYYRADPFLPKKLLTFYQRGSQQVGKHLAQLISVSIAAWIGALIPSIIYFHTISFSALGANIIAVPLAFVILLTALLSLLSAMLLPWLAVIFNNANWFFVKVLLLVVHGCTLIPYTSFSVGLPTTLSPRCTIFDLASAQAAILQVEGRTWVLNAGRAVSAAKTILPFLEASGIKHLEGLLVTGHEAAVAGGAKMLFDSSVPRHIIATPGMGHSLFFRHFVAACLAAHHEINPLLAGKRIDFSKECWGEVFSSSAQNQEREAADVVLKLHLGNISYLMIPTVRAAAWLVTEVSPEQFHADIVSFCWSDVDVMKEERLLVAMAPKVLILPDSFLGEQKGIREEEKQFLQQHGIKLLSQHETGAIIIDAYPEAAQITGFLNKESFLMKP